MPTLTPNYGWNLPLVNDPTDEDQWGGLLNENISDQDTVVKSIEDDAVEALNPPFSGELTISSSAVTATGPYHSIDTEGDAATDDLVTISGVPNNGVLIIRPANDARSIVVKNTGNIKLPADITLNGVIDTLVLKSDGTNLTSLGATPKQGRKAETALQPLTSPVLQSFLSVIGSTITGSNGSAVVSTGGTEFFTRTITPKVIGSRIRITFVGKVSQNSAGINTDIGLFNGTSLIAYDTTIIGPSNIYVWTTQACAEFTTAALTPITVSGRVGGSGTYILNRNANTGNCYVLVEEILV